MFNAPSFQRDIIMDSGGDYRPMTDSEKINDIVAPLMNFSDKLVLGGSLSLKMFGLMKRDRYVKDLDFGLTEKLTQYELDHIKDFFEYTVDDYSHDENYESIKIDGPQNEREVIHLQGPKINIDIFNTGYLNNKEVVHVLYNKQLLKLNIPSIPILAKAKYMLQHKSSARIKHFEDIKFMLFDGETNYYRLLQYLEKTNNQYISLL
jgi:hypothetical protein